MRVLLIDPDPARAALVAEGLEGVEPLVVQACGVVRGIRGRRLRP